MGMLFSNRYLDAFAKTIVVFGITHILVLSYEAVRGNVEVLNAFYIVSLNLVIPELGKGLLNFVLSYCLVACVFLGLRLYNARAARQRVG